MILRVWDTDSVNVLTICFLSIESLEEERCCKINGVLEAFSVYSDVGRGGGWGVGGWGGRILAAWPKQRDHLINIWLIAAGRWLISVCYGEHLPGLHAFLCNGMPLHVFLYPNTLLGNKLFPLKIEHNFAYSSLVPFHSLSAHKSKHRNENPQTWLIAFPFYLQVGRSFSSFFLSVLFFFCLFCWGLGLIAAGICTVLSPQWDWLVEMCVFFSQRSCPDFVPDKCNSQHNTTHTCPNKRITIRTKCKTR